MLLEININKIVKGEMMKVIIAMALVVGLYWHFNGGLPGVAKKGAYDDAGNATVWVFTIDDCQGHCERSLKDLNKRGVPYVEKLVNLQNQESDNFKLWMKMGRGGFPFFVVGEDKVVGFVKPALSGALGKTFGEQYLTRTEKKYYQKHFYPDGSPKIVMYGTDWCPGCAKLRKEFKEADIDFVDFDVEKPRKKEALLRFFEIRGYPATWVGYTRVNGLKARDVLAVLNDY